MSTQYCTPVQLRDVTGDLELSQVATPEDAAPIDPLLMKAEIEGDAVTIAAATADQQALGARALAEIVDAIKRASAIIDTRLRVRFTVPLVAPIPDVLIDYCAAIARFDLHRDRATDEIRYRYEHAMSDLDDVANGKIDIGISVGVGAGPIGFGVAFVAPDRDNTYATLGNFDPGVFRGAA